MSEVLDYSSGWPRNIAPYAGTVRYVGTPGRGKNLTAAEWTTRSVMRTPTAFVHETTGGWMSGGAAAGVAAGHAILADLADLGIVELPGVYAACDFDARPDDLPAIDACLAGMTSVLGPGQVSVYGSFRVVEHCVGRTARLGWQTRAWSGGQVSDKACLLQQIGYVDVDGVQCDRNTVLAADWGQWPMEDDVTYAEARQALLDVLKLPPEGLAVPPGQLNNGQLAVLVVGAGQAAANRDSATAAKLRDLAAAVDAQAFADAVVARLPVGSVTPLTGVDVERAVKAVLASAWAA